MDAVASGGAGIVSLVGVQPDVREGFLHPTASKKSLADNVSTVLASTPPLPPLLPSVVRLAPLLGLPFLVTSLERAAATRDACVGGEESTTTFPVRAPLRRRRMRIGTSSMARRTRLTIRNLVSRYEKG